MPPAKQPPPAVAYESDSDTDSEGGDSVTNVQLGLADGEIEAEDETNPLVSRIGGRAAWLPTKAIPPVGAATCRHCNNVMELLVQIFAPLEGSPYDRTLLAWGCARPSCQRKGAGSIRVVRHLQFNKRWAAKLEKKKAKQEEREQRLRLQAEQNQKRKDEEDAKRKINPFASGASQQTGGGLFGGGFGDSAQANPFASASAAGEQSTDSPVAAGNEGQLQSSGANDEDDEEDDESEVDEQDRLAEEMAMKAAVEEAATNQADWTAKAPAYQPALYLNTVPESSSSARAGDKAETAKLTNKETASVKASQGLNASDSELKGLEKESYERMMLNGVDEVFEKFVARVGAEGRQVVRYELGGTPLSFNAQGEVYDALWPKASAGRGTAVSKAAFGPQAGNQRSYDASKVPPCPVCNSPRNFEVQLMPALINTLRPEKIKGDDSTSGDANADQHLDAQTRRRMELEAALGKKLAAQPDADGITRTGAANGQDAAATGPARLDRKTGLCWSTAMIFVCEKDCCIPRGTGEEGGSNEEGETWREEWVALQFED